MATRPVIFKWRQTDPVLILCAVRWYLRYSLSLRDVEEQSVASHPAYPPRRAQLYRALLEHCAHTNSGEFAIGWCCTTTVGWMSGRPPSLHPSAEVYPEIGSSVAGRTNASNLTELTRPRPKAAARSASQDQRTLSFVHAVASTGVPVRTANRLSNAFSFSAIPVYSSSDMGSMAVPTNP
jgi:hypothetical protein